MSDHYPSYLWMADDGRKDGNTQKSKPQPQNPKPPKGGSKQGDKANK
ncbi:MAG: hypothetical protein ACRDMV_03880 [Streptosporangiales bacterium]